MFKKLFAQIREFLGLVPDKVRLYASRSLQITTALRTILISPIGDLITAVIPGDWDEAVKDMLIKYLGEAIPYLKIVDTCKDKESLNETLLCWVTELSKQPEPVQQALLHKLAALLTAMQDNKQLKQSLYDLYVQAEYSGSKVN